VNTRVWLHRTILRRGRLIPAVMGALLLTGCQAAGPRNPDMGPVPVDDSAALVEYIANEPFVTAEPAVRATYGLATGETFEGDYDALVAAMKTRGLIGRHWDLPPDRPLRRGDVGVLLCRACDIRTGLNWMLTGLGRYGYRELQYREIAGPGGEFGLVSGGEFVGMLTHAEDYLRRTEKENVPERVPFAKPES
jgi:hypothetical protein